MKFSEVVAQTLAWLQREGRVSYRALRLEFDLTEEVLDALKEELIEVKELAIDKDGKMLVWVGNTSPESRAQSLESEGQGRTSCVQTLDPRPRDTRLDAGERRQLTVMFIDLVGSTTLSQQLDPEDYHARVVAYQTACHQIIARYEGHIAQYLGDGVLVYFGYPTAHEEDAVRAVRSGLEIVTAVSQLGYTPPLQVRIGIHTGLVVVGEIGSSDKHEILALGETPNLAARVQGVAEPDTVAISAATQRLVQGFFPLRSLGSPTLKGISTAMEIHQVLGEGAAQSRFEVAVGRGLTPLVGREEELGLLRKRWEQTKTGEGQVVLLSGEAGIGKSRLVQLLKEQVAHESSVRVEYRCSPYYQNSAFYPLIEHFQRLLEFHREDSSEEKLRKLEVGALRAVPLQPEVIPLLAALLSIPLPAHYPPLVLTPQRQKQKTLEALVGWLVQEARRQPVLVVVEDVHWVDPSTLEFLSLLLEQAPTTRILLLLAFRPDFTPPWAMFSHITHLTLSRLARRQVEVMVEKVTGGKPLPTEVIQQLITKTDGVPLFVEELTKMVVESGLLRATDDHYELSGPLPPLAIPATLQDSLIARLDRLATVKEVAQLGATLGREFSYELIHAVAALREPALHTALAKLVEVEILYQRGSGEQACYVFKHALIQDTAYQSLLKSKRQQLHQQIAKVLEEHFPETKAMQPEILAHHYTCSGNISKAVDYLQLAGQQAAQRFANAEASTHLTTALRLLTALPPTPELIQQELVLQTTLGPVLMATKGYGTPEVGQVYARARELCQQSGETAQLGPVLYGLWAFYNVRAEYRTAYAFAEQLLSLAESQHDTTFLLEAHWMLGASLYQLGELTSARAHWEQSLALYNFQEHRSLAYVYGLDDGVTSRSWTALVLWHLGYADQSLKKSEAAITLAREVVHPHSLVYALTCAAWFHQLRREEQRAQEQAEAAIALSTEHRIPLFIGMNTIFRGWALAEQGKGEEGIAQMRQGMIAYRATGAEFALAYFLALLAEAYGKVGQVEEGLSILAEALAVVDRTEERVYEAELYRLKGELTLTQSSVQSLGSSVQKKAEECFLKAIEIARKQQAKSLELRAVMSLVRLRQQQASEEGSRNTQHDSRIRLAEDHQMLSEVYHWFTEGFDTKDLQEAKALLESLESSV
jgi:class 3 adenylate cyclase/predicted ATPase